MEPTDVIEEEFREGPAPREVTRFEARLLRILRFFLHQVPAEQATPLVQQHQNAPACLSADAVHLVKDTLAKGCVLFLVRSGGWRRERFLRRDKGLHGRIWDRWPLDERRLSFSRNVLDFLIWITANKAAETKPFWPAPGNKALTPADQLLLFLAFQELRSDRDMLATITSPNTVFSRSPLCWLTFPDELSVLGPETVPTYDAWMTDLGAMMLESLQPMLTRRWLEIERGKGQIGDWQRMRQQGQAQDRVLERFLDAAENANRQDLARFLLNAGAGVLSTTNLPLTFWTGGLQGSGPPRLADRLAVQRSSLSLMRAIARLHQWEQRARTIGFTDEGYASAQLWLSDWEGVNGDVIHQRAQAVLRYLEPLRAGGGASPTAPPPPDQPQPEGTS